VCETERSREEVMLREEKMLQRLAESRRREQEQSELKQKLQEMQQRRARYSLLIMQHYRLSPREFEK